MRFWFGWSLAWLASCLLALSTPTIATAQDLPATVETCRELKDSEVRDKISELTAKSLKSELSSIDFAALVNTHWAKANVNARIDKEVDEAITAVKADSRWIDRAYSTVSQASATRFATAVTEKVYNSSGFKAALEDVATGVATDVGARIVSATAKASSPIVVCVQTALQSRYGGAVAQVFATESEKQLETAGEAAPIKLDTADLVVGNAGSISGIVLIVTRKVIARVVTAVSRRIASVVATRVISSVAGLLGLVLVAKDLYDAGEGVFPIISERMKAAETKTLIQDEVSKTIQNDINQQVDLIAQETAERIFNVWLDFKQKYNRLLSLSEKYPNFAAFLKDRRFDQLGKLGQIVDIVYSSEGEAALLKRVDDGSLNRALTDLPDAGVTIATQKRSLSAGLDWAALAGQNLPKVADYGLYQSREPKDFTKDQLAKLLTLDDRVLVERVAGLDNRARSIVLGLSQAELNTLARRLTQSELSQLALFEVKLAPLPGKRLLRAVLDDSRVMKDLSGPLVRQGLVDSKDQGAALDMLLRTDSLFFGYGSLGYDYQRVRDGDVAYEVFLARYWASLLILGLMGLIVLAWLRRLLFGRSR